MPLEVPNRTGVLIIGVGIIGKRLASIANPEILHRGNDHE
jgi:hypothetical protein